MSNRNAHITAYSLAIALALIVASMIGCATPVYRDYVVTLPETKVHIVAQDNEELLGPGAGRAWSDFKDGNKVWVYGVKYEGQIMAEDYCALGHEIEHILQWHNKIYRNPDKRGP